ncbi:MAG: efflux RND transporter periplasmic adaptor subunit [Acidobacteria bacterium]|nr:efflux RND transporter periplasmic adaptor subunit [Acidobacteriota bacterium]
MSVTAPPGESGPRRKKPKVIAVIGGLALLAVIVIASLMGDREHGEKVYATTAETGEIESVVSATGAIDPKVKLNISAHVIGKIEKLYFNEGDWVEKGQKLVELERVAIEAVRDRTSAQLRNAQIEVRRAQVNLDQRKLELDRARQLHKEGVLTEEAYERARLDYENAAAAVASANEGVRQAQAALDSAQDDLNRTTLVAPISGRVVSLNAREGEVVVTGTMNNPGSVIATIADLSDILVEALVSETEVVEVSLGQRARVEVDAIRDHTYEGQVAEIGSSAEASAAAGAGLRFFNVKVLLNEQDDRLRPGMTANVEIVTNSVSGSIRIPVQSVVERGPAGEPIASGSPTDERISMVPVVVDGVIELKEVETGISDATHVQIVSGIDQGDLVVTGPFRTLRTLRSGDRVVVTAESSDEDDGESEDA